MIRKIFFSAMIIVFVVAGMAIASIKFIDRQKIYQAFVKKEHIDMSAMETGNLVVKLFPTPYLIIDKIEKKDKIIVKNIKIYFSLASLLTFDPQISDFDIEEVVVRLNNDDINLLNHDELISELIGRDTALSGAKIGQLFFVESDDDIPLAIKNFNFKIKENKTDFSGEIDKFGVLEGLMEENQADVLLKLKISDQSYSFNFEENYKNKKLEKGKFVIKDLETALNSSLAEGSEEKILASCDIISSDYSLDFINIAIDSDSFVGSGEVNLSKNNTDISSIKLEFSSVYLPKLLSSNKDKAVDYVIRYFRGKNISLNKNPMTADISIKDVVVNANNTLSDVNIKAKTEKGKLYLHDFSGKADQGGDFKIDGIISQNSFRSLFNGKILLKHRDLNDWVEYFGEKEWRTSSPIAFVMSSDLELSSLDISLNNLAIQTKDTNISGNVSTKYIGNSPRSNAAIKFSNVNLDKDNFPFLKGAFNYSKSLFRDMKDEDYLNKYIPIRKFKAMVNYDLTFDKLIVENKEYQNVRCDLELAPGFVSLNQLYIQDGNDWVDASVVLDVMKINPIISLVIKDGSMKADFLSPSGMLSLREKIKNNFDLSKISIVMDFAMSQLVQGSNSYNNIIFQAKNTKDLLEVKKFDIGVLGGRVQSSGSILLNPYTFNFVYSASNIHVLEIAKLLPRNMLYSGGLLSASGMWSTNGDTLDKLLYNLYTRSKIVSKGLTVQNFSIDNLIEDVGSEGFSIKDLNDSVKKAMLTGETEISDLKTDLEFSKGVANLSSIVLTTKYSSATASALFDLYKFSLDGSAIFSFYFDKPM
ncbi:MAG: AsmA-like C-terminal region-containing protein [Rickettsiaceae bacterium]|nr:AsmA-like C-terminal region-containing protein [Rickettsiaceae bacterium]